MLGINDKFLLKHSSIVYVTACLNSWKCEHSGAGHLVFIDTRKVFT